MGSASQTDSATTAFFSQHGGRFGAPKRDASITDSLILALLAAVLISGLATYLLWQVPTEKPAPVRKDATAVRHQKRSTPDAAARAESNATEEPATWYDKMTGAVRKPTGRRDLPLQAPAADAPVPAPGLEADIPLGMLKANVIDTFGKPELSAHTLEQKHLMEVFVYFKDHGLATFVLMQDGKVVSSYTGRLERPVTPIAPPQPGGF